MLFRTYQPRPPLSGLIENFWLYEGYSSSHRHERIFPTGAFELVFNLRDDELRTYEEDDSGEYSHRRYAGSLISGPYYGFFVTDRAEESSTMGVHFRPGGAFPFLGQCAYELADTHLDLATIWGRHAGEIRERLATTSSALERFRLLESALRSRIQVPLEHHPAVSLALDGFRASHSHPLVRKLAREAGLSDRRFIDIFRSEVGLNPKLFSRIERFQELLLNVHRCPEPEWEQLALQYGYFDQSHLIRDFHEFSGFSPVDYLRRLKDLRDEGVHVKFNHLPVGEELQFFSIQQRRAPAGLVW